MEMYILWTIWRIRKVHFLSIKIYFAVLESIPPKIKDVLYI